MKASLARSAAAIRTSTSACAASAKTAKASAQSTNLKLRSRKTHAMKTDRFPYEASRWSAGQPEQAKRWLDELEIIGAQNVRARLAQVNAGSGGSIPIGTSQMTIGFAQEWLAWHDRRKEAVEE